MNNNKTKSANGNSIVLLNKSKKINKSYTNLKLLGKSRYAVFVGQNNKKKQLNAIKIFPKCENDCVTFEKESKISMSCDHQNIIKADTTFDKFLSFGNNEFECNGLVMEYAPFGDLFHYVQITGLDEILTRTIFRKIVDGVQYLHSRSICHLDLKTENIVFGTNFEPKICDFGHSQILQSQHQFLTCACLGTSLIKPPEMWYNQRYSGVKADVFSLGVMLFTMLGGMLPFEFGAKKQDPAYKFLVSNEHKRFFEYWQNKMPLAVKMIFDNGELCELISQMLAFQFEDRPTVDEIKKSKWFNGPVLELAEFVEVMKLKLAHMKGLRNTTGL
jgi:serine/threonine protein kinase